MSEFFNILKTLFLIIFFGNPITLTPSPIEIEAGSRLVFNLEKPARVIGGAYISIDVTSMRPTHVDSWKAIKAWGDEVFGDHRISATLINTLNGNEVKIYHRGGVADTSDGLRLFLRQSGSLERGKTYDKIVIETDVELNRVTMRWISWSL